jgi:RND family efflux transporter MFP subunit
MSSKIKLLNLVIPILILLIGAGIMALLIKSRPEPKKDEKRDHGTLVTTFTVKKEDREVIVTGTGTVEAAQEVSIIPQVSGRTIYVSPSMVAGGLFQKGDLLFEIEDTDYRLALEQAKALRAKAEYDLAKTESQARIARTEWKRLNKDTAKAPNPLVVYEPQLKNARASLASAEAAVEQAELNLSRTKIRAPFNCRVRSEDIDLGQYVSTGKSVAVLAGTDAAEILVPLSLDKLSWIKIPRSGSQEKGSNAVIAMTISGQTYKWNGRIIRSLGEVDNRSRMMQVVVNVLDPYKLLEKDEGGIVLSTGTFVEVSIKGKKLSGVFLLPRTSVRDNATVWIMDDENMLRIRPVTIVRQERAEVLVSEGLTEGERIVMTSLAGVSDGMKLRLLEEKISR